MGEKCEAKSTTLYSLVQKNSSTSSKPNIPRITKNYLKFKSCLNYQVYQLYKMVPKVPKSTKVLKVLITKICLYSYENKQCCMPSSWKGYCKTTNQWLQHYDSDCSVNYILFWSNALLVSKQNQESLETTFLNPHINRQLFAGMGNLLGLEELENLQTRHEK